MRLKSVEAFSLHFRLPKHSYGKPSVYTWTYTTLKGVTFQMVTVLRIQLPEQECVASIPRGNDLWTLTDSGQRKSRGFALPIMCARDCHPSQSGRRPLVMWNTMQFAFCVRPFCNDQLHPHVEAHGNKAYIMTFDCLRLSTGARGRLKSQ